MSDHYKDFRYQWFKCKSCGYENRGMAQCFFCHGDVEKMNQKQIKEMCEREGWDID